MGKGINEQISTFLDVERKSAQKALSQEKNQVSINPNTYIAKEIMYQTALLQQILHEIGQMKFELEREQKNRQHKCCLFRRLLCFRCKR